jgi:hypothetical protein
MQYNQTKHKCVKCFGAVSHAGTMCDRCRLREAERLQKEAQREAQRNAERNQRDAERNQRDAERRQERRESEQGQREVYRSRNASSSSNINLIPTPDDVIRGVYKGSDSFVLQSIGFLLVVGFTSILWHLHVWSDANLALQGKQITVFCIGEAILLAIAFAFRRMVAAILRFLIIVSIFCLLLIGAYYLMLYMGLINGDDKEANPTNPSTVHLVQSAPTHPSVGAGDNTSSSIIEKMPGVVPPVSQSSSHGAEIKESFQGALFVAQKTPDGYLNVRSGPGLQNPVVGRLPSGARGIMQVGETIHDTKDQIIWMPVRFGGVEGYVSANFLQPE